MKQERTGMNNWTCKAKMGRKVKETFEMEINLERLLGTITLGCNEAERELLDNINKIELMQFLGLKDKFGKVIHFGDILVDKYYNFLTPVCEVSNDEHILFFKPIQHLGKPFNIGCKSTYSDTLAVVGNIYENSELFCGMKAKNTLSNFIKFSQHPELLKTTIHIELSRVIYG